MIGLVWRRRDFRESSRLISFVTRERGLVTTLAKGAHRPKSPLLGRIDWLGLVEIRLGRGELPILHGARLVHEPRALREPTRFVVATFLAELFDPAWIEGRADADLFDLTQGALTLVERAPLDTLPEVLLGLEFRLLEQLGVIAPAGTSFATCVACGKSLTSPRSAPSYATAAQAPGLRCASCRPSGAGAVSIPIPPSVREWATEFLSRPARTWIDRPGTPADLRSRMRFLQPARNALANWSENALERRTRHRELAWRTLHRQLTAVASTSNRVTDAV